jgi:hypothetical protein
MKQEKEVLERKITENLKDGPVQLSVDCKIEDVKDMDKPSVRFSVKRVYKRNAEIAYRISQRPTIQMVLPFPGAIQNGIVLDPAVPLPIYAPSTYETNDYTQYQMVIGLFLMLEQEKYEYYLSLLKSFDLDKKKATPELKLMLKGKYWNDKRFKRVKTDVRDEPETDVRNVENSVQDIPEPGEQGNEDSRES